MSQSTAQGDDASLTGGEYAVSRLTAKGGGAFWHVGFKRNRHIVSRSFFDRSYGDDRRARAMAIAYRDAVLAAIPPCTNRDLAVRGRGPTATGHTGVYFIQTGKGAITGVETMVGTPDGLWRKRFPYNRHRPELALALAVAQRQDWLEQMQLTFVTRNKGATERAETEFAERLDGARPQDDLTPDAIAALVAGIDALFDALRPLWLTVTVAFHAGAEGDPPRLTWYVAASGLRTARMQGVARFRAKPFEEVLAAVSSRVRDLIEAIFGADVRSAFDAIHGDALTPGQFNRYLGIDLRIEIEALLRQTPGRSSCTGVVQAGELPSPGVSAALTRA